MFKKTLSFSAEWHKNNHSGDTIDKIGKASENLHNFSESISQVVSEFVGLFGSIIILAIFDWKILVIALTVSIFSIATIIIFDKKLRKSYKKIFKAENYLASGIHDYISNIITVITLRLEKKTEDEIEYRSMRAYPVFTRNLKIEELKN